MMGSCTTKKDIHVPFLKCRGSHYEVGFQIGKEFKTMMQDLLRDWKYFETLQKIGSTPSAKAITHNCLRLCKSKFPGYVDEIRGMADGANIDFEKLFLLNIDSMLSTETTKQELAQAAEKAGGAGCTSIICNKDEVILGHTEDAMAEIKDHVYIIAAEILSADGNNILEKFTTLCYAGTLMGYTMGYNSHGMVYSVNTIFANVCTGGTPRAFIARALLGAVDLPSLIAILKDKGNGVADGFSLNVYFYPTLTGASGSAGTKSDIVLYNIEIAPTKNPNNENESIIDIHEVHPGSTYAHCNRYLRIESREWNQTAVKFSDRRNSAICRHQEPCCEQHVKSMLSDQTDADYPVYNDGKIGEGGCVMNFIRTVAVGIFNINRKTWSVFAGPPTCNKPEHVFNL